MCMCFACLCTFMKNCSFFLARAPSERYNIVVWKCGYHLQYSTPLLSPLLPALLQHINTPILPPPALLPRSLSELSEYVAIIQIVFVCVYLRCGGGTFFKLTKRYDYFLQLTHSGWRGYFTVLQILSIIVGHHPRITRDRSWSNINRLQQFLFCICSQFIEYYIGSSKGIFFWLQLPAGRLSLDARARTLWLCGWPPPPLWSSYIGSIFI